MAVVLAGLPLSENDPGAGPQWRECYDPPFLRYIPRDPIRIVGDENLTAANGVLGGDGTPSNPFRIAGWLIIADGSHGIEIQDTDAFVLIEDVDVCGGAADIPPRDGVKLINVTNARVERAGLPHNRVAISVLDSSNVSLVDDYTYRGYPVESGTYISGIEVVNSSDLVITGFVTYNEWERIPIGISLMRAQQVAMTNNLLDGVQTGIRFDRSSGVRIMGTTFCPTVSCVVIEGRGSSNISVQENIIAPGPIYLEDSRNASITGNLFVNNCDRNILRRTTNVIVEANRFTSSGFCGGLSILQSDGVLVMRNTFSIEGQGLEVSQSSSVRVQHNSFETRGFGGGPPASDDGGAQNAWDSGYPGGGNYWSDYRGVDLCTGPRQDICPSRDGLGDVPYTFPYGATDRYPLMWVPGETTPPDSPVIKSARIIGTGGLVARIAWSASTDEGQVGGTIAYEVQVSDASGGPFTQIGRLAGANRSEYVFLCWWCSKANVEEGALYLRIRSIDAVGNTAPSNVVRLF